MYPLKGTTDEVIERPTHTLDRRIRRHLVIGRDNAELRFASCS